MPDYQKRSRPGYQKGSSNQQGSSFQEGNYLIEFITMGGSVKVSAIDPISKHEVSIVGSRLTHKDELIRVAVQKLEYMMGKR